MIGRRANILAKSLLAATAIACSDSFVGTPASADHSAVFEEVWSQFDLHYSFFALKQINWDSLGAHYRPLALAASNDQALANVLAHMLADLHDVHVSITPTGPMTAMRYVSGADTISTYFSADLVFRNYVPVSATSPTGYVRYGMLTASTGYLRLASFDGDGWSSDVDGAMDELRKQGATHLVIDVRDNLGGKYLLAADIAGRFADRSRTYGYVRYRNGPSHTAFTAYAEETVAPSGPRQFTGPVYVLSNRHDFSSAEDFIMAMHTLPNATIVGDTTAGASGGPIVRELQNGWTFQLSEWIEYTPAQRTFEGVGLAPDVVVKATAADAQRNVDAALERALALAQLQR